MSAQLLRRVATRAVPQVPGVYAIFDAGVLVYIGSSLNLSSRLKTHASDQRWGLTCTPIAKFSPTDPDYRVTRERALIKRLTPPLNQQWHPENSKRYRWRQLSDGTSIFGTGREALQIEANSWRT